MPAPHYFVVPAGFDDPLRPSGGNTYALALVAELAKLGHFLKPVPVAGSWPLPSAQDRADCTAKLATLPPESVVVIDGLIGAACGADLDEVSARLRLILLVHQPIASLGLPHRAASIRSELAALRTAHHVVTTSQWTSAELTKAAPGLATTVVSPGVVPAEISAPSATGHRLLCVAAVTPLKGHDVLLAALSELPPGVSCLCVGSMEVAPDFARDLQARANGRLRFSGPLSRPELALAYARADLVVHPSYSESYGLVLTEALARAVPVLATDVGGVREAVGTTSHGLPGLVVAAGNPAALSNALQYWFSDQAIRQRLRQAASVRRAALPRWDEVAHQWMRLLDQSVGGR